MSRKGKFAIAPVAGFLAGLGLMLKAAYDDAAQYGDFNAGTFGKSLIFVLTGFAEGSDGKWAWSQAGIMKGLVPFVSLSLLGWGAHKMANKLGVNRSIPWVSI